MLTDRQAWLLRELGDTRPEKELRACHRECVEKFGAVRDFTRWLVKRVHRHWQAENRRARGPYLGD